MQAFLERRMEESAARLARSLVPPGDVPLRLVLWNGEELGAAREQAHYTVRVRDWRAALRLVFDLRVGFGDLYAEGRVDVEGDLVELLRDVFQHSLEARLGVSPLRRAAAWLQRPAAIGRRAARRNASHHYDVGNSFYALWLDRQMVYSCAYFADPRLSLEDAQCAKLDYICRKLGIAPGERVVDVGSGWGALALHMAREYGARVRAFNVSREQLDYSREQARRQGLASRVEFVEADYRDIAERCDALVSVGMLEHVGLRQYEEFGRMIDRCLSPSGRGLLHSIGRARPWPVQPWVRTRIFPQGYLPSLRELLGILEPQGLVPLDVENLRRHYALTLRHWLARYASARRRAVERVGSAAARAWELYLAGACAAFESGGIELFQVVFSRSACARIPWTRAHWYDERAHCAALQAPAAS